MENSVIILAAIVAGALAIFSAVMWARANGAKNQVTRDLAIRATELEEANAAIERLRSELAEVRTKTEDYIRQNTAAVTRLDEASQAKETLLNEIADLRRQREEAITAKTTAEKEAALRQRELEDIKVRMEDWETTRKEALESSKAAILKTATDLSNKLLDDHKRESEEAKKQNEEQVKKATEDLLKRFQDVSNIIASLNDDVGKNRGTMETVLRALSSPGGAGQTAEIGLENTLKSFGLEKDRDFFIQKPVEGTRLRPDVLILLPGETVWVVDSKSSKYFLELAESEGTEKEGGAYQSLSRSMNKHLHELADKNYAAEVKKSYRESGRSGEIRRMMTIMYLPNDGAIEKLKISDNNFLQKSSNKQITLAGPSILAALIGFARIEIDLGRQIENQEQIIHETSELLDRVGVMLEAIGPIGSGIFSAATHYKKLTGSVNTRLLPTVIRLSKLGVRPSRTKQPKKLPIFEVIKGSADVIEGEAEEINEIESLPSKDEDQ